MRKYCSMLLFLAGILLLLWPGCQSRKTLQQHSRELERYQAAISQLNHDTRSSLLDAADIANDAALLAVGTNEIIGSVAIPALRITLPIYIGTDSETLARGVGLLEGSSVPVGGSGRHTVLSAHRGLPEARMFRDLDRLVPGDIFTITVLGWELTYQVDQILVTLPSDTSALMPRKNEDLCTLLTCTPYGINSHRLLVRGHRI